MNLFVTALNSGSNGNCYYVGNEQEAVLIDAGISCRETEKRMARLGLSMHKVKAIFISHEHSDHVRGVRVLSKKYQLPIYITPGTLQNAPIDEHNPRIVRLTAFEPIQIGSLSVKAFPKNHDARDPHSFIISNGKVCVGVFTDIGVTCENLIEHFKCCHAAFLEANYDTKMLYEGKYPYYLKKRIDSDKGHLSNEQALELFLNHKSPELTHLFLSHISKENNSPEVIRNLFMPHAGNVEVILASRESEIPVYEIGLPVTAQAISHIF
ncbi:MAG TPA: MBL fold metallo-hydrolase [Cytophagaceae bacterium]